MSDEDIIKAMWACYGSGPRYRCRACPFRGDKDGCSKMEQRAYAMLVRQRDEIERLKK